MAEKQVTATEVRVRNKRRPFNVPQSKLELVTKLEGWHYRWVNDYPGRITKALQADYVFAEPAEVGRDSTEDNRVKELAGSQKDGSAMYAYLMRIPYEFYLEDKATSQQYLDEIDTAIRGGKTTHIDKAYIPDGGISIKNK